MVRGVDEESEEFGIFLKFFLKNFLYWKIRTSRSRAQLSLADEEKNAFFSFSFFSLSLFRGKGANFFLIDCGANAVNSIFFGCRNDGMEKPGRDKKEEAGD